MVELVNSAVELSGSAVMASDDGSVVGSAEGRRRTVIVIAADGRLGEESGQSSQMTYTEDESTLCLGARPWSRETDFRLDLFLVVFDISLLSWATISRE